MYCLPKAMRSPFVSATRMALSLVYAPADIKGRGAHISRRKSLVHSSDTDASSRVSLPDTRGSMRCRYARSGCRSASWETRKANVGLGSFISMPGRMFVVSRVQFVFEMVIQHIPWYSPQGLNRMAVLLGPTALTTALTTSSGNLARFWMLPPYASSRVFDTSWMN